MLQTYMNLSIVCSLAVSNLQKDYSFQLVFFFPLPSFCNTPWAVETPICNNHLKASIFHFGLYDWLHLQSILWYSLWKTLDERRYFTGRQWQCRGSKATTNFLHHALLVLISVRQETSSELVKWYCKKLSFSNRETVTETIQSKECQIKWQDFNWIFIYKAGQMASVVAPVFYSSHLLESFFQTMVQMKRWLGALVHAVKAVWLHYTYAEHNVESEWSKRKKRVEE